MNNRERFRKVLAFERVDRLPRFEWASWWNQTLDRWQSEGLPRFPEGQAGVLALMEHFRLDPVWQVWFPIQRPTYPLMPHGEGPVRDLASYEAIREHLYPEIDWERLIPPEIRARHASGEVALWYTLNGFFWYPRQILGIERHLFAFYDQPELIKRINADLVEYNRRILRELADYCEPEFMTFAEDLSYNQGPMLSKALFDEFIAPGYRELVPLIRGRSTVPLVDSDGNVEACVLWFAACGIEGMLPFERQSGVDIARIRQSQPRFRMIGAFDKMTMARSVEAMRAE